MGTALHLNEIGQIALTVSDLPASVEFYRDVLGMNFLFNAGTMAFLQCGSVRLLLGTAEKSVGDSATIVYFRVPDIQLAHETLVGKGVPFTEPPHLVARMKSHDLWLAFLKDPAGNTLGLMSEIQRTPEKETK